MSARRRGGGAASEVCADESKCDGWSSFHGSPNVRDMRINMLEGGYLGEEFVASQRIPVMKTLWVRAFVVGTIWQYHDDMYYQDPLPAGELCYLPVTTEPDNDYVELYGINESHVLLRVVEDHVMSDICGSGTLFVLDKQTASAWLKMYQRGEDYYDLATDIFGEIKAWFSETSEAERFPIQFEIEYESVWLGDASEAQIYLENDWQAFRSLSAEDPIPGVSACFTPHLSHAGNKDDLVL